MAGSKTLTVKLIGDIASMRQAFGDAAGLADDFGGRMRTLGQGFSSVGRSFTLGVTLPIVAGFTAATHAAAEDAQEQNVLRHALEQNVGATDTLVASVEDWITSMQMATGVADNELRQAMTELVNKGSDVAESQEIIQAALDLAAGAGVAFTAAIDALAKAADGNTTSLRRMGIETTNADGAALSLNEILVQVSQTMGGSAAAAADTVAGRMAIAQQKFSEAAEALGTSLIPVMETLAGVLSGLADWFSGLSPGMQDMIVKAGLLAAALGPLSSVIGGVMRAVSSVITAWPSLVAAFSNPYILGAAVLFAGIATAFAIFSGNAAEARQRVDDLAGAMEAGTPKAEAFANAVLEWQGTLNSERARALNSVLALVGTTVGELTQQVATGAITNQQFNDTIALAEQRFLAANGAADRWGAGVFFQNEVLRDFQSEVNSTAGAMSEYTAQQQAAAAATGSLNSELTASRLAELAAAARAAAAEVGGAAGQVDALGIALGRLPQQTNVNVNVSASGSGVSFLGGRAQ